MVCCRLGRGLLSITSMVDVGRRAPSTFTANQHLARSCPRPVCLLSPFSLLSCPPLFRPLPAWSAL